ncbi:unnamed protein product [Dicrocoelium dendriticum]|nr:unnamed protein product [Dicrocoelium dendriticum]
MSDVISVPVTLIRSFKFRTTCYITLHEVPATTTLSHLFDLIEKAVRESPNVPPPFKTMHFDALKLRHQAHRSKSGDLLVDMKDEPILKSEAIIKDVGIGNETEVAVFNLVDYQSQKENPEFLW